MGKTAIMAKKRGPKPKPEGPREGMITVRCQSDYKEWVNRFARFNRTTPAHLIDIALVDFAKKQGFDEPPPER